MGTDGSRTQMTRKGWQNTALRTELFEQVEKLVEKQAEQTVTSVSKFVEIAVREKLARDKQRN
jgi:hypothetical protein